MLRFRRPDEPASFAARVRIAREAVTAACAAGRAPEFPDLWSDFKRHFVGAQHNKCGYCEALLSTTTGALEHYRPKAALQDLPGLRSQHGQEIHGGANVEGRLLVHLCASGYPWAAYTWDNYLLACERCNSAWKRCLFPVAERPRTVPPTEATVETPLLLNPFEVDNPADHLTFDPLGQILPRSDSPKGQATIDTCGLARPSLAAQRFEKARDTYARIVRLLDASSDHQELTLHDELCLSGAAQRPHAGMVRAIFEAQTGLRWEQIFGSDT